MLTNIKCILKSKRADSYIDVCVAVFCIMLLLAFIVNFFPVFMAKYKLDVFASEIVREAEIKGSTDISERIKELRKETGLNPAIVWECNYYKGNKIQLDNNINVTLTDTVDIGFFIFKSFPIELQARASGKSEIYYKE